MEKIAVLLKRSSFPVASRLCFVAMAALVWGGVVAGAEAEARWGLDDFSGYPDAAALARVWTAFDENNPAPDTARVDVDPDEGAFLRLENTAAKGYGVLVRACAWPDDFPFESVRVRLRGSADNGAPVTLRVAFRPERNVPDVAALDIPVEGAAWTTVSVPAEALRGQASAFVLLSLIHPPGRAARVDVASLEAVGNPSDLVAAPAPLADGTLPLERFGGYADADALAAAWTPFDNANPAPAAMRLADDGDGGTCLQLENAPDQGFSVLTRACALPEGFRPSVLRLRLRGSADNGAAVRLRIAARPSRNAPDLFRHDIPVTGNEWRTVELPAEELIGRERFRLVVFLLHETGKTARVDIGDMTLAPVPAFADTDAARAARRAGMLAGRMVQFDTEFPYYRNRSADSIADELRLNRFDAVYYIVQREEKLRYEVAPALQRAGLGLGVMIGPAMINLSEAELDRLLPAHWREWRVEYTIPGGMDPYIFIGMVYPEYNAWFKRFIADIARRLNLDGFTFAEVHFPNYDGPSKEPVFFCDVSPNYQKAFLRDTGEAVFPEFHDRDAPHYYTTDTRLYRRLLDYRVDNCNAFYDDLVNGPAGLREHFPGIVFATWTLATSEEDGLRKMRDWEGNDLPGMVARVKPDIHFIQTHAPDWLNPEFAGTYVDLYRPFFDQLRAVAPDLPIGFQADFGSRPVMRRDPAWVEEFHGAARRNGIDVTTYYEFSLRWEVYNTPPALLEARRTGPRRVRLAFDQRLGPATAEAFLGRDVHVGDVKTTAVWAMTDGHWLTLELDRDVPPGRSLRVALDGVVDDPTARLALSNVEPMPYGPENAVPSGTIRRVPLHE